MSSQENIISNLSTLTKVPNKILEDLVTKTNLCIGNAIYEALQNKADTLTINVGIGNLSISLIDMQCKFLPSKDLKTTIKKCLATKVDPVAFELEEALIQKLLALYKSEV